MNMFQFAQIPAQYGSLNQRHLARINDTVMGALDVQPRLVFIRCDLHEPKEYSLSENSLEWDAPMFFVNANVDMFKRFFASFKAQVDTYMRNRAIQGKRLYKTCYVNYIWVRELSKSGRVHYHVVLILNKDLFYKKGSMNHSKSLVWKIKQAWASALGMMVEEIEGLVHISEGKPNTLGGDRTTVKFQEKLGLLAKALAYLAKEKTKAYGDGRRNFGCSNPRKGLI
ncbi:inovirus-type Gp2 protein [Vibrio sp. 10N.261.51.F12]|uniref:YagK/YfjJ domain-containing protein n=1 Tax=Vibrio sp. 10N.261.51.F12 TaxID=3229679 RepID=UPI00355344A2